jgi:hypothetical protein
MLSSNQEGEIIAAVAAIQRALQAAGADWHDLAHALTKAEPAARDRRNDRWDDEAEDDDWRAMHAFCSCHLDRLSEREQSFMATLDFWCGDPTERQFAWLSAIYARLRRAK